MVPPSKAEIAAKIIELCRARGSDKTICPSEAARELGAENQDWRALMSDVRDVSADLVRQGAIDVCQSGRVVDVGKACGPIRLRLRSEKPDA